jgi:hypothetical protein
MLRNKVFNSKLIFIKLVHPSTIYPTFATLLIKNLNKMKNQDLLSKRIMTVAIAVSIILCSAALFVFTLNFTGKSVAATTKSPVNTTQGIQSAGNTGIIACAGILEGKVYYIYNNPEVGSVFWRVSLSSFNDADKK